MCILVENLDYEEPHQFGYEIVTGFRQMAEPAGFEVEIVPVNEKLQRSIHYDMFMLQHDYIGAFALGFTLQDRGCWIFRPAQRRLFSMTTISNPTRGLPMSAWTIMKEWNLPSPI